MDCALIQGKLIEYQFATLEDVDRESVEAHLLACKDCLRTYLALKAQVDRGSGAGEVPSEAARLRLRAAVEARFRTTATRRLRGWLSRPMPLYQGLAIAALVAVVAALAPSLARSFRSRGARPAEQVDTARPAAESLTIY
jgi:anti-sigma factor RsiW